MGEGDDRLAVESDLLGVAAGSCSRKGPEVPKPALLTSRSMSTPSCCDLVPAARRPRSRGRRGRPGVGGQLPREALQPVGATSDEDQLVAAGGELARELFADSRGSAGDECGFANGVTLFSFSRCPAAASQSPAVPARPLEERVRSWEAEYLWEQGDAVLSGDPPRARGRTARCARRFSATATGSCTRRRSGGSSTRRRCSSRRRATTTGPGSRTRSRRAASRGRWPGRSG